MTYLTAFAEYSSTEKRTVPGSSTRGKLSVPLLPPRISHLKSSITVHGMFTEKT